MNKRLIRSTKFVCLRDFPQSECLLFLQRSGAYVQHCRISYVAGCTEILEMFVKYCHNLICCTVRHVGDYSKLLRVNPKLVEISLYTADAYSGPEIALPNLEHISLVNAGFDNSLLIRLIQGTSRLRSLRLFLTNITAAGLIKAVRFCPMLRLLQPPDLNDIDSTLLQLTNSFPYIEYMCLIHCSWLTDAGIIVVAQNVTALHSIQFACTNDITTAALLALADHQHQTLEAITIKDGYNQTDISSHIAAFCTKCVKLRRFEWQRSLFGLAKTDCAAILARVVSAGMVTTLLLSHIDDAILLAIARYCAELKVLNLLHVASEAIDSCSDTMWLQVVQNCSRVNRIIVADAKQCIKLRTLLVDYSRILIQKGAEN